MPHIIPIHELAREISPSTFLAAGVTRALSYVLTRAVAQLNRLDFIYTAQMTDSHHIMLKVLNVHDDVVERWVLI